MAAELPAGPPPTTIKSYIGLSFPCDSTHTKHGTALNLHPRGRGLLEHLIHFLNGVCATHRSRCIMAVESTSIKCQACINQGEVNWIAHQVVDDHRGTAHAEAFVDKLHDLPRFQVMSE